MKGKKQLFGKTFTLQIGNLQNTIMYGNKHKLLGLSVLDIFLIVFDSMKCISELRGFLWFCIHFAQLGFRANTWSAHQAGQGFEIATSA